MAKQVIYRRGTTAEHANFVGANGEITVDTVKHVVIVHDGVTAGGFPLANASTITANISALTANAANQAAAITVLQANAAYQSANIATLFANAAAQQANITAFILASNATAIFANISAINANLDAANAAISSLIGNATVQSEAIVLANANIIALQSGLTAANVAIASFVTGSGFANIGQLTANITAVNSAISTQGTTFATNVAVAGIRANVTAANVAISSLQAGLTAANVTINNIALSPALIAEVTQSVTDANTAMQSYVDAVTTAWTSNAGTQATDINSLRANVTAANSRITTLDANLGTATTNISTLFSNAATQATSINTIDANLGAYQTYGNLTFSTVANAATQAVGINTINANVAAANSAIQSLSANIGTLVAGAPGALDTLIELGNALGNNASFSATMVTWLGNITSNITAANSSITTLQTQVYANANVSAYLSNYNGSINFTASPAVITGLGNISSANFTFGNGVNILSNLYANAAVQSANIATINNTLTSTNVAIGYGAGQTSQGGTTVAVGAFAGMDAQGLSAVAIGFNAGQTTQGIKSVAIGMTAGYSVQGNGAVAIGDSAGYTNQGVQAIAIGRFAGLTNQANNTIILNATGANLNATTANTFTVAPIRGDTGNVATALFYNTTTKEITTANIMLAAFTMSNHQQWTSNVSTIGAAINQLAERIYNIENP